MRHGKKFNHLGRTAPHRKSLLSNMACSLVLHKRIETTLAKAKELRKYVEPLITKSKDDSTHSRRTVFSYLQSKEAIKELFGVVSEKIGERPGGYTRIIKLGTRLGDAAEICMIELVDFNEIYNSKEKIETKTRRLRRSGKKETSVAVESVEVQKEAEVEVKKTKGQKKSQTDDLAIVEGIGPKVAELLNENNIITFAQLADTSSEKIREILEAKGGIYASMKPDTWAKQAELARDGKWDELKSWQDELNAGKEE